MLLLIGAGSAVAILFLRARSRDWLERWSVLGLVAAAYLMASVAFFWQFWLLPNVTMPRGGGDLVSFLYPTYAFAAASIQAGHFPFWNPHLFAGMPFAADPQSGVFYPPNLVAFALVRPFTYDSLVALAVLHYPIAALAAFALGRQLGLSRLGAFAAGLAFAFSGFCVAHLGHYNMLAAAAWVPLAIATLLRAQEERSVRWAVLAGGAYALVVLPGHSQTALYTAATLGLVALASCVAGRSIRWSTAPLLISLGLGAAASAVQLFPTVELARASLRSEITYQQAAEFAASPRGLITFVLPWFFGNGPDDYWGLPWSLQESYGYVGVVGLMLVAVGLVLRGRDRQPLAVALIGLFWLLVALGETTPFHGWMYRLVPGFDLVRAPGRGLLFVDLAAALLIGFGITRIARASRWRDRVAMRPLMRLGSIALIGGLMIAVPLFYYAVLTSQDKDPALFQRTLLSAGSLNVALLMLGTSLLVVWRWRRGAAAWPAPLLIGLLFLDLAVAHGRFNPTTDDLLRGYQHDAAVAWLQEHAALDRVDTRTGIGDAWQPNLALVAGVDEVSGLFNPLSLRAFDRYWEALGSRSVPGYDLLAVRHVVARRDTPLDSSKFRLVHEAEGELAIFENTASLPRAFVAPRAEYLSEAETQARLRDPGFDPSQLVLLEDKVSTPTIGGGSVDAVVRGGPNDLEVTLRDVTGGYLVVSEVYFPGWRATVDGLDVPAVRSYGLLRAVPLPPGAREVRMSFRPTAWLPALTLSVLAWLVVVAAAVAPLWRVRQAECVRVPLPMAGTLPWR